MMAMTDPLGNTAGVPASRPVSPRVPPDIVALLHSGFTTRQKPPAVPQGVPRWAEMWALCAQIRGGKCRMMCACWLVN